jgi:LuxR family transcriptional regulator, maltose regulon positive regulatory protein
VEAKLAAPSRRAGTVLRPRIMHALDAGEGSALTLLAAPAGYGKTTAVRDWCASRQAAFAWVTLDAGDIDPVRLWTYAATAVDRVRAGLGRGALQRLRVPGAGIETAVDELMNGVAAFGEELVLVLDDLQSVTDAECLASVDYALEHLPATARLIAITRTDPALRLARLRSRGSLAELRASELAFTAAEARELLVDRCHVGLDSREIEVLCERTEGWPAALFLAALWLQRVEDPGRAVREFGGDNRFVADYLSQEALGSLDDDTRSFLLRAAVLGRFTADLCDGVLGRSDSASVLAELERSNLFVLRLERGGWFRVHSLLAEFAGLELAALEPGTEFEIHRHAARWLLAWGLPVEAAEHAHAAGDHELVAELLVENHMALIRSGSARTLLRWVRTLPDDRVVDHPELAVGLATAATMIGQHALERRRLLQLVDRAQAERPERFGPSVQAVARMVRAASVDGDVGQAVLDGRTAVELAQAAADDVLVAALAGYARALYLAGELDQAWAAASQAVEHPDAERRAPGHAFARSTLALVAVDRGRLGSARTHAEKARAIVGRVGSSRSWLGANASAALGAVLAAEGDLAEAERELASAEHLFRDEVATVHHAWLLVLLARVRCRRGRLHEAEATLRSGHESLAELSDSGRVALLAADVERELAQAKGRAAGGELLEAPTEAELAVLRLLVTDLSARAIGGELYLSANTVRSHTRAIYRKLGVNSRADAVARATALGFLEGNEITKVIAAPGALAQSVRAYGRGDANAGLQAHRRG